MALSSRLPPSVMVSIREPVGLVQLGEVKTAGNAVGAGPQSLRGVDRFPVGWLPDGSLLVVAGGCDGTGDLYQVPWDGDDAGSPLLVVRDVTAAAVRVALPPPPAPPGEFDEGFA